MSNYAALPKDPPWLKAAFADLGLHEVDGPGSNPVITEMYRASGQPRPENLDDSKISWCSAAMNYWFIVGSKLSGTKSLAGRSWLKHGKRLDINKSLPRGAVLVLRYDDDPNHGHVCILLEDMGDRLKEIGANQSNGVNVSSWPRSRLIGAIWPADYTQPRGAPAPAPTPPAVVDFELRSVQQRLKDLGYTEVGIPNGEPGSRTVAAIAAFQKDNALPVTGEYDRQTAVALANGGSKPRMVSIERASTTVQDLRAEGSETVKAADSGSLWSKALLAVGIGGGAEKAGVVDAAQEAVGKVSVVGQLIESVKDLAGAIAPFWPLLALALGGYLLWTYRSIIARRLADHVSGAHAGR